MLSPLMFGHNVSSVHHCHTRPAQLLRGDICIKLSHHGAVIWRHTAPRPVVWDPGIGQALPHYHTVACQRKRHKEMGSQQLRQLRQCARGFTQKLHEHNILLKLQLDFIHRTLNRKPAMLYCYMKAKTVTMTPRTTGASQIKVTNVRTWDVT